MKKLLLLVLLLVATPCLADEARFRFSYDNQGVAGYAIDSVEAWLNGRLICVDDTPEIDANGDYNYFCSVGFVAPVGAIEAFMTVITVDGHRLSTTLAMGTMPPVEEPDPDPLPPVLESGEIERDADGFILTLEITTNPA
jgi:hypothetical protein